MSSSESDEDFSSGKQSGETSENSFISAESESEMSETDESAENSMLDDRELGKLLGFIQKFKHFCRF